MANVTLKKAKQNKQDEFYTQIKDIEQELKHYKKHFLRKIVFCNCDDPEWSNFWKYFELNFDYLGLKKLISTHYEENKPSYKLEIIGDVTGDGKVDYKDIIKTPLKQNGDFRSPEAIEILKEADIVVTNKEIFTLIQQNKIWSGNKSGDMEFKVPDYYEPRATRYRQDETGQKWRSMGNICWFTNLDISKRHENLILYKQYNESEYPSYENYDAINIDKVTDIPLDYDGVMGVPITYLDKYNPKQFEIIELGIVGSCTFTNNRKMEILDKNGLSTGKFTYNAKGTL